MVYRIYFLFSRAHARTLVPCQSSHEMGFVALFMRAKLVDECLTLALATVMQICRVEQGQLMQ